MCAATSASVELLGLFHARKLARTRSGSSLGWDRVHQALRLTRSFYDRFTPAISARDFRCGAAPLDRAPDLLAVLRVARRESSCTRTCPTSRATGPGRSARSGCRRRSRPATCRCSTCSTPPWQVALWITRCCSTNSRRRARSSAACVPARDAARVARARRTRRAVRGARVLGRALRGRRRGARAPRRSGRRVRAAGRGPAAAPRRAPLLATDAGVRLQLETGIAANQARFGAWGGGSGSPSARTAVADGCSPRPASTSRGRAPDGPPGAGRCVRRPGALLVAAGPRASSTSRGAPAATRPPRRVPRLAPLHAAAATAPGRSTGRPTTPRCAARQVAADAGRLRRARPRARRRGVRGRDAFLGHFWHEGADLAGARCSSAPTPRGCPVVPLGADVDAEVAPGDVRAPHGLQV